MRVRAILNPRAGLSALSAVEDVRRGRPSWKDVELVVTTGPGHARTLAEEAARAGFDLVLSIGGDGTANEVAAGLLGTETVLGLVPMGSGNGLARVLRIPLRPDRALRALEDAVPTPMDVGSINGRIFLNVAGVGFDAVVGDDFHHHGHRGGRRGVATYVWLCARRVVSYRPQRLVVRIGEEQIEGRPFVASFVNGRQYGGGAVISPGAHLDDGRLELVLIDDVSLAKVVLAGPRLFLGNIEGFKAYSRRGFTQLRVSAPEEFLHHRDGEPEAACRELDVRIRPRALRILVPRATAEGASSPFLAHAKGVAV
jgi:diacylglycerol kinase (ATP)